MEPIIQVRNLKKYFGDIKAVDDISFEVGKGELFGFLGVNGAGKTTTINMLCTLLSPTEGEVYLCGNKLGKEDQEISRKIGIVYQQNCLDEFLTVKENLLLRGGFYEKDSKKVKKQLSCVTEILSLQDVIDRRYAKLSGGQKRRCEIARALMNQPEILFLDEPTTGLDPATRQNVWKSIDALRNELKTTVFLTTHYMEEAVRASHIAILDAGKMKEFGTPFTLKEQYAKDKLRIVPLAVNKKRPENPAAETVKTLLSAENILFKQREEFLEIELRNTMEALSLLEELKPHIQGFEVIQGSMDDVFLNVTGKTLKTAAY